MPINFNPTSLAPPRWKRPETGAVFFALGIQAAGLAAGVLGHSLLLSGMALGGSALLGAAFVLARRG